VSRLRPFLRLLAAVPCAVLIRLLRPLVLVRLAVIPASRFGHFVRNLEIYVARRRLGIEPRAFDVFYLDSPVSNQVLATMWRRVLTITPFARDVDRVSRRLPGAAAHRFTVWRADATRPYPARDPDGAMLRTSPALQFTASELRRGRDELAALGIPPGAPYVCIHARDSAYQEYILPNKERPVPFHDVTVESYLPAAEELTRRGYHVLRMGARVKRPLVTSNPAIIDYASLARSEFLDLYISATCAFFLGSGTGLFNVPLVFRRPVALANLVNFEFVCTWMPNYTFITKTLWHRAERRTLTFSEMLRPEISRDLRFRYDEAGIEVVENSADEIVALAVEIDERRRGIWSATEADEARQQRFWSLWERGEINTIFNARIGTAFLRQHEALVR
jgi:putative glycosyltransferase (TIGR04372 family)